MKIPHPALLIATTLLFSLQPAGAEEWKTFSPEDSGFSVEMPGTPTKSDSEDHTLLGTINEDLATTRYESDTYSIEFQKLPEAAVALGGKSRIFDDAKNGLLKEAGASETTLTETQVDGNPAKRLVYSGNATKGEALFVLAGQVFYVLDAQGSDLSQADIEKFLSSFQIES